MVHKSFPSASLAIRERYHDEFRRLRDPICEDRMLWRAQAFRHCVHLMPGQSILELGCGEGLFTSQLARVSRGDNPITAVSFDANRRRPATPGSTIRPLAG